MLTVKKYDFSYKSSPNGSDFVIVELNENIDESIIINSWKETISVITSLGVVYFNVSLRGNYIYLSTSHKDRYNDATCGSFDNLKRSVENYVSLLNNRIKNNP